MKNILALILPFSSFACCWTSTAEGTSSAWNRHFDETKDEVNRYTNNVKIGLSCRCLKDW